MPAALATSLAALAASDPARADMGVPMIALIFPGMLIALVPIIVVEGIIVARRLALTFRKVLVPTVVANVVSTVVGMPITWGILLLLEGMTGGNGGSRLPWSMQKLLYATLWSPWLPDDPALYWILPAAALSLLGPFFFASWLLETEILWRLLLRSEGVVGAGLSPRVRDAALRANLASYGGLALLVLADLVYALIRHGLI